LKHTYQSIQERRIAYIHTYIHTYRDTNTQSERKRNNEDGMTRNL
jgi:hypothetical protein